MNRDKSDNTTPPLAALSVFRGIYKRVAVQLDIDPSYVSRVARGERNAPFVSEALRKEIRRVLGTAGLHNGNGNGNGNAAPHENHTPIGDKQVGRKQRKTPTQKSASAGRRRKS
jgi:hypothetical protein